MRVLFHIFKKTTDVRPDVGSSAKPIFPLLKCLHQSAAIFQWITDIPEAQMSLAAAFMLNLFSVMSQKTSKIDFSFDISRAF